MKIARDSFFFLLFFILPKPCTPCHYCCCINGYQHNPGLSKFFYPWMTNEDSIGTLASPNPALSSRGEIYLNIYFIYINEGWDRKAKCCSKEILAKGKGGREREKKDEGRTYGTAY